MKKRLGTLLVFVLFIFSLTGCNVQPVDLTFHYDYAYISLPNGECVEGEVDSWRDFEDGDQLQIVIDGVTYLTDTTRAVLISH